ncbi:MAG TPA: acyl-CoA synthetase [Pirellulaceae bacterium]|nr:acyl-CoA synthetase [Pirellulaceae bacterium]
MKQLPLIERAMAQNDRVAIRSDSQRHTYADLVCGSAVVAATLLDDTDDLREARVAYLVPAGCDYVLAQWGIWRAGGIAVPLSLSATEQELKYALTDSQANIVIATSELADRLEQLCEGIGVRLVFLKDVDSGTAAPLPEIDTGRRAMILYTSGTTSTPKGVVTTHACIQAQIETLVEAWRWQPNDRIPLFLPLHHVHGIINVLSCALWSGAEVEPFLRFDLEAIFHRVAANAYTVFMAVPTVYVKLIDALESMSTDDRAPIVDGFARMRLMISGSAALPASVHTKWTELTGQDLLERYGMTEIGMALSNPYDGERRPGAVGQPLPGVEIRLQSEAGKLVTDENNPGEILVRGPSVFREYWNRPEATRESFDDGWFRTGDIAVLDNGYYRIMGRNSVDIIKSGGYKLSALEIEAVLLDHPSIRECAVVGLPDDTWGETVAAAIVLKEGHHLDLEALRFWCQDRISHYKVPSKLLVVDPLPRNAMGKVTKPAVLTLIRDAVSAETM